MLKNETTATNTKRSQTARAANQALNEQSHTHRVDTKRSQTAHAGNQKFEYCEATHMHRVDTKRSQTAHCELQWHEHISNVTSYVINVNDDNVCHNPLVALLM